MTAALHSVKAMTKNDVLLGRGRRVHMWEGNVEFRRLVAENGVQYYRCNDFRMRDTIARELYNKISHRGGRFLREDEESDLDSLYASSWVEISSSTAMKKIKQALRDSGAKASSSTSPLETSQQTKGAGKVKTDTQRPVPEPIPFELLHRLDPPSRIHSQVERTASQDFLVDHLGDSHLSDSHFRGPVQVADVSAADLLPINPEDYLAHVNRSGQLAGLQFPITVSDRRALDDYVAAYHQAGLVASLPNQHIAQPFLALPFLSLHSYADSDPFSTVIDNNSDLRSSLSSFGTSARNGLRVDLRAGLGDLVEQCNPGDSGRLLSGPPSSQVSAVTDLTGDADDVISVSSSLAREAQDFCMDS